MRDGVQEPGTSGLQVSAVGLGCNNFGMRIDLEQTKAVVARRRSTSASPSSTRPTSTAGAGSRRSSWARRSGPAARTSSWRRSSRGRWATGRCGCGRLAALHLQAVDDSLRRLRHGLHRPLPDPLSGREDADRGDAAGARRRGARGQGALRRLLELHGLAGGGGALDRRGRGTCRRSSPRRTSTTCWTGASSGAGAGVPRSTGSASCRTSRWRAASSPASTSRARQPPEGTRLAAMGAARRADAQRPELRRSLGKLEAFAQTRGHTMLELAIGWLASHELRAERDRGRDEAGAGRGEREGGGVEAHAGGDGGGGRDHEAARRVIGRRSTAR